MMSSHLFCLQCELDEDLLQLLVDKVDAELLEAVLLHEMKKKKKNKNDEKLLETKKTNKEGKLYDNISRVDTWKISKP